MESPGEGVCVSSGIGDCHVTVQGPCSASWLSPASVPGTECCRCRSERETVSHLVGLKKSWQEASLLAVQGLQEDLLLCNEELGQSLPLVPGKENRTLWNFPSKISVLIM